jgi:hypothetical protein
MASGFIEHVGVVGGGGVGKDGMRLASDGDRNEEGIDNEGFGLLRVHELTMVRGVHVITCSIEGGVCMNVIVTVIVWCGTHNRGQRREEKRKRGREAVERKKKKARECNKRIQIIALVS